jgi:type III secretion system low calcium response chaperone LcrH/SycD
MTTAEGRLFEPEDLAPIAEALLNGAAVSDFTGLTAKELDGLYALGHQFYAAGAYDKGENIFTLLCFLDQYQSRFWLGLGGCRQGQNKYTEAVKAYEMATLTSGLADPAPVFQAALCYLKLADLESARDVLKGLEEILDENKPEENQVLRKTRSLLEAIQKQLVAGGE